MSLRRRSWRACQNFLYILLVGSMMNDDGMSTSFRPMRIFTDGRLLPCKSPKFMRRGIRKVDLLDQCVRYSAWANRVNIFEHARRLLTASRSIENRKPSGLLCF